MHDRAHVMSVAKEPEAIVEESFEYFEDMRTCNPGRLKVDIETFGLQVGLKIAMQIF